MRCRETNENQIEDGPLGSCNYEMKQKVTRNSGKQRNLRGTVPITPKLEDLNVPVVKRRFLCCYLSFLKLGLRQN